jgi:hypothetical protein
LIRVDLVFVFSGETARRAIGLREVDEREPIRSIMLEMFKPNPVNNRINSATVETLFITGA